MTIGEFTSAINNSLNSVSLDDFLSREYIYWMGINNAKLLLKRESDQRNLFKNLNFFTKLDCVDLKEVDKADCDVKIPCNKIMRSKKKLPTSLTSKFGDIVKVYNITKDIEFTQKSAARVSYSSYSKYKKSTYNFWIQDGYLFIPDSTVKRVLVYGIFLDPEEVKEFNGEDDSESCTSIYDTEFPVPEYLLSTVTDMTLQQVFNTKRVPKDENGNLNVNMKQ